MPACTSEQERRSRPGIVLLGHTLPASRKGFPGRTAGNRRSSPGPGPRGLRARRAEFVDIRRHPTPMTLERIDPDGLASPDTYPRCHRLGGVDSCSSRGRSPRTRSATSSVPMAFDSGAPGILQPGAGARGSWCEHRSGCEARSLRRRLARGASSGDRGGTSALFGDHKPVETLLGVETLAHPGCLLEVEANRRDRRLTDSLRRSARFVPLDDPLRMLKKRGRSSLTGDASVERERPRRDGRAADGDQARSARLRPQAALTDLRHAPSP